MSNKSRKFFGIIKIYKTIGGRYRRNRLRVGVTLAAAAAIALIAGGQPGEARAADGTTDVTVQVAEGDENLAWSVPTQIPMKATAAGTLIGPGADAIAIRNLSAFPIRVKQMDTIAEAPFHLVDDVDKSSGSNDFQMTINGSAAKQTVELPDDGTWSMGYMGNETGSDVLPITVSSAKIVRVTEDLAAAKKAATVTWTVEPTTTIKPEPKPDPENGTIFAIDSPNGGTTKFYKRNRVPDVGETFEGEMVEADNLYTGSRIYGVAQCWKNPSDYNFRSIETVDYGIKLNELPSLYYCDYIYEINLVKLDTSQVTSLAEQFSSIENLSSLDVSTWDTSKVTNMEQCFKNSCKSRNRFSIDLSGWDTSNVTSMHGMFKNTPGLSVTGFDKWSTSNVTDMSEMFSSSGAVDRGIEGWDVSSVEDMSTMFGYSGYTEWETNDGVYMPIYTSADFSDYDLSNWDVSNVMSFHSMFDHCYAGGLDLSEWDVSKGVEFSNMFAYCESTISSPLNVSNWDLSNVFDASDSNGLDNMFSYCNIDLVYASNWILSSHYINYMFYNSGIGTIDLSSWVFLDSLSYCNHMFDGCHNLTTVEGISNWEFDSDINLTACFKDCPNLVLDCSSWNFPDNSYIRHDDFNTNSPGVIAPNWSN